MLDKGHLQKGKTPMYELGVKEEGGHFLEGVIFLRNYGTYMISVWYT